LAIGQGGGLPLRLRGFAFHVLRHGEEMLPYRLRSGDKRKLAATFG
jgi:hypothetical protein